MVQGPWDPWSQAPGPLGPMVQGPWGPWAQATYCQAKLPTARQAKTVRQAPNRSIDLHPTFAYMHPRVSVYMHPKAHTVPDNSRGEAVRSHFGSGLPSTFVCCMFYP